MTVSSTSAQSSFRNTLEQETDQKNDLIRLFHLPLYLSVFIIHCGDTSSAYSSPYRKSALSPPAVLSQDVWLNCSHLHTASLWFPMMAGKSNATTCSIRVTPRADEGSHCLWPRRLLWGWVRGMVTKEKGLPWWLSGKESACQWRRYKFDPWVWKTSWRRKWQPTPVFLPGKSQVHRSLVG